MNRLYKTLGTILLSIVVGACSVIGIDYVKNNFSSLNTYDRLVHEVALFQPTVTSSVQSFPTQELITPNYTQTPTEILPTITPTETQSPLGDLEEIVSVGPLRSLEETVYSIRLARAISDPDYIHRINEDLYADRINFLFIGKGNIGPPDAYKLISYNTSDNTFDIISFPRDLYVPELGKRINVAWSEGDNSPTLLIPIVENITGLPVDFYFYVDDTNVIRDVIDSIGGVYVDVGSTCYDAGDGDRYSARTFEAGSMLMNGETAARYSRLRQCDADNQRMVRQIEVGEAIMERLTNYGAIEGLERISNIFGVLERYESYGQFEIGTLTTGIRPNLLSLGLNTTQLIIENSGLPTIDSHINLGLPYFSGGNVPRWFDFFYPFSGERRFYQSFAPSIVEGNLSPEELRNNYYNFPLEELGGLGVRDYVADRILNNP